MCKGSSAEGGEGLFFTTRLGEACKHAPHTCKSLYTREPENSPIIEVSFAYFSFQRKVRSKKSKFVGAEAVNGERLAKEVRLDAGVVFFAYGQLALADEGHRVDIIIQQGGNLR